jgi:60 kDa SS-A/Ro ribonucleoprotein
MSINYTSHFNTTATSQSESIPGKKQVKNSAGGYSFEANDFTKLDRFLILGTEGGSYYASEHALTVQNAANILKLIQADGKAVVDRVVEISEAGRAPKNDAAIFVLAMAAKLGNEETRKYAFSVLPRVARIGTHLFTFVENISKLGGFGRATKRGLANWYTEKDTSKLAYQMVKYQSRNGWSHADVIRLAHVKTDEAAKNALFQWAGASYSQKSADISDESLRIVRGFEIIKKAETARQAASIIQKYRLPRECVPTQFLNDTEVWEALLPHMGLTALIRNLGKMTSLGFLAPLSETSQQVVTKLSDEDVLRKSRVHPLTILNAMMVYNRGAGLRGSLSWSPVQPVVDALDDAFYVSFGNVEPTGKKMVLGLDVSGSMDCGIPGTALSCMQASAAMALVTANVETNYAFMGFSHTLVPVNISPKMRLDDVVRTMQGIRMGRTDCSLPMLWALQNKFQVDVFSVYTDSETWYGRIHPSQALEQYRKESGIDARLVVIGMVSNNFTIADPNDPGMLDVVGFDTATPQLISDFSAGKF